MDSLVQGEQCLDWHLLFSASGVNERQIATFDPSLQSGVAHPEHPGCEAQREGLAELAFEREANLRELAVAWAATRGATQPKDIFK